MVLIKLRVKTRVHLLRGLQAELLSAKLHAFHTDACECYSNALSYISFEGQTSQHMKITVRQINPLFLKSPFALIKLYPTAAAKGVLRFLLCCSTACIFLDLTITSLDEEGKNFNAVSPELIRGGRIFSLKVTGYKQCTTHDWGGMCWSELGTCTSPSLPT